MPYVTPEYYKDEFGGIAVAEDSLNKFIKRAERDINRLVRFRITDFNKLPDFTKKRVQEAVCAQVEFLAENGETSSSISSVGGSFSIGSYSENNSVPSDTGKTELYADAVYDYLYPTGLMYAGVGYHG